MWWNPNMVYMDGFSLMPFGPISHQFNEKKHPMSQTKSKNNPSVLLWGKHVVQAVLHNPDRHIECLYTTSTNPEPPFNTQRCPIRVVTADQLAQWLPRGAVHQGVAVRTSPLNTPDVGELDPKKGMVLILDGIVDPHNVGALWRSAAVFGASALIVTKNNCPPLDGVVSKTACGASELIPCITVSNLVRAMETLKTSGFFCVGLAEEGSIALEKLDLWPLALVIGSEGVGLRRLTRQCCDALVSISSAGGFSTLNASVAGAIALQKGFQIGQQH
jgi:23S rRNA (guanosine2251-2'-O)-methyltransferase